MIRINNEINLDTLTKIMSTKCRCGACGIRQFAVNKDREYLYKNLYGCIDCNRRYLYENNKLKLISMTKFRKIIIDRIEATNKLHKK